MQRRPVLRLRRTASTVNADGTLELRPARQPSAAPVPIGTYPQIFADTATLNGGTLVANIAMPATVCYETTVYDNVIDANTPDR